jgi:two-component system sensor histidine kinase BaeS
MNRLWVRLSLMISGVLFFMFFMQFLTITLEQQNHTPDLGSPLDAPPAEIQGRLLEFMAFSILIGTAGGIVIARVISAPVRHMSNAAQRIGKGELDVRVPVRGSQEMIDLANTFNKMAADLQHAEILRTNLMADVSHELRTPLTVLEGNLRAALDKVVSLDEAEVANLYGQTRHLIRLVNDLRELSLAESGQLPLEMVPTNLNILVTETLQALEPLSVEKGVSLTDDVPPLPETTVDPFRIRQVLFNLLSNALRHTPHGGKIIISGESSAGMVVLSVQDNGEGLEPEQISAVFDRFYRADKSRNRETGGTGLGLAIIKAIVEAHGGKVEAHSAGSGQGSTFIVRLPQERRP